MRRCAVLGRCVRLLPRALLTRIRSVMRVIPPRSLLGVSGFRSLSSVNRAQFVQPREDSDDECCGESKKDESDDQRASSDSQSDSVTDLAVAVEPFVHEPSQNLKLDATPTGAALKSLSEEVPKGASYGSQHLCRTNSRLANPTRASRVGRVSIRLPGR